jgi:hypothetical protein
VLGYFWKKLQEVLDALLEPFWCWVSARTKELSWQVRTLLLVLAGLVALAAAYWNSLPLFYRTVEAFGKIVINAPTQIPLDSSLTFKMRETSRRLAEGLRADLNDPENIDPPSAWTLSILAAASNGMTKIKPEVVRTYFSKSTEIACNCWPERPESRPNIAVSGWVLFALAELNFSAAEAEVRFLLNEQKRDGWWSVFQATDDQANASTFGTAWALIGLQTQLRNQLIPPTMEEEVSNAIEKGSSWLIRHRSGSRWKDYPFHEKGAKSDSLSGLVMHALHMTASGSIKQLKKEWMDNLPAKVPAAGDASQNFVWVKLRAGAPEKDDFVQIALPWMLIATADAYSAGNYFERTRTLLWMERALYQESVVHADTQVDNWWRAELLLALRYVVGARYAQARGGDRA